MALPRAPSPGRYRTVIVIPETQSQEKKDTLRICGAELVEVPAVPYANPNNYVKYSRRLAEALAKTEPAGAVWCVALRPTVSKLSGAATPHFSLGGAPRPAFAADHARTDTSDC